MLAQLLSTHAGRSLACGVATLIGMERRPVYPSRPAHHEAFDTEPMFIDYRVCVEPRPYVAFFRTNMLKFAMVAVIEVALCVVAFAMGLSS